MSRITEFLDTLSDDDLVWLQGHLSSRTARIIDERAHVGFVIKDRDDEVLEHDFAALNRPRKKRAERLNEEEAQVLDIKERRDEKRKDELINRLRRDGYV